MRDPNLATYYCFVGDRKLGGEGLGPATTLPGWPPTGTKVLLLLQDTNGYMRN